MSDRTKNRPTPKRDKWKDPFYAYSRGRYPRRVIKIPPKIAFTTPELSDVPRKTSVFSHIKGLFTRKYRHQNKG